MGYLYILSTLVLLFGFLFVKKSEEKLDFIKWLCIAIASLYAYNITLCMTLGLLHITQNIWLLALINTIIGCVFLYKPVRKWECQKYTCSKLGAIGFAAIIIIFVVMFVKDLYIFNGDITHYVVDPAIHYRAAQHYSNDLKLFVFDDDKTFFDFNIMQTGAYINDGIFMNVVNSITGLEKVYIFQLFESLTMFVGGMAFYAFIIDRIKTKKGLLASICLFGLYLYGYPYNSWIFGFSYLSVGIAMVALFLPIVEMLFSKDNINKVWVVSLIVMTGMGLIFSYCLFIPAIFAAICIYIFLEELKDKNAKKYLKIFGKYSLIVTGLLLIVTALGIGYLFIPSFLIEGQTDLVSALQEDGGIYEEKYKNFIAYFPFIVLYVFEIIKRIKEKSLRYFDVFFIIFGGYVAALYLGMFAKVVSKYYMLKTFFILWLAIFGMVIDLVNEYIDKKIFRIDAILLVAYFLVLVFGKISIEDGIKTGLYLTLILATVLPDLLKDKIHFEKIRITGAAFVILWTAFVCTWVWFKAGHVFSEEYKHSLPNLVCMYYQVNCEERKALDMTSAFTECDLQVTKFAREKLEDLTADNSIMISHGLNQTIWGIATLEYDSDLIDFRRVMGRTNNYDVTKAYEKEGIKYIMMIGTHDQDSKNECQRYIEQINQDENIELLYSNEEGFVAEIINK